MNRGCAGCSVTAAILAIAFFALNRWKENWHHIALQKTGLINQIPEEDSQEEPPPPTVEPEIKEGIVSGDTTASAAEIRKNSLAEWNQTVHIQPAPDAFPPLEVKLGGSSSINFDTLQSRHPAPPQETPEKRFDPDSNLKLLAVGLGRPTSAHVAKVKMFEPATLRPFSEIWDILRPGGSRDEIASGRLSLAKTDHSPKILLAFHFDTKATNGDLLSEIQIFDAATRKQVSSDSAFKSYKLLPTKSYPQGHLIIARAHLDCWHATPLIITAETAGSKKYFDIPLTPGFQLVAGEARFQLGVFTSHLLSDRARSSMIDRTKSGYESPIETGKHYELVYSEEGALFVYRLLQNGDPSESRTTYTLEFEDRDSRKAFARLESRSGGMTALEFRPNVTVVVDRRVFRNTVTETLEWQTAKFPMKKVQLVESSARQSVFRLEAPEQLARIGSDDNLLDVDIPYLKFYSKHEPLVKLTIAAKAIQFEIAGASLVDGLKGKSEVFENTTPRELIESFVEQTGISVEVDSTAHILRLTL